MLADCRDELVGQTWFRQVSIAAGALDAFTESRQDVGSDYDDRNGARLGVCLQAPAHFQPVELRHREIEDDDIGFGPAHGLDRVLTVFRFVNDEAGVA